MPDGMPEAKAGYAPSKEIDWVKGCHAGQPFCLIAPKAILCHHKRN
jgi:hypothetical protein